MTRSLAKTLKPLSIGALFVGVMVACGQHKDLRSNKTTAATIESLSAVTRSTLSTQGQANVTLLQSQATGPNFMLMDGNGLQATYLRVFGPNPRDGVSPTVFTPTQMATLGTLDFTNDNAAYRRVAPLTTVTQDYLVALRDFLSPACTQLISREWGNISPSNSFIHSKDIPSITDINGFMSVMFGYTPPGGMNDGAADYASAASAAKASFLADNPAEQKLSSSDLLADPGYNNFVQDIDHVVCMAIGEDPRVFVR